MDRNTLNHRYHAAAHAMQSGVAADLRDMQEEPKHIRVGINSALVNDDAVARLLMKKGIITEDEYLEAIAEAMEREVERYEAILSERTGVKVKLL